MNMYHHTHGCECGHEDLAYCKKCDVVWCRGCGREWGLWSWMDSPPYTTTVGPGETGDPIYVYSTSGTAHVCN